MKKVMICFMALLISSATKGQQPTTEPILTKEDYLLKSRRQRTAAIVIGGVGAAMLIVGGLVAVDDFVGTGDPGDTENSSISSVLIFGGIAFVLVSVPFSILSRKNLKKAAAFSIQPQTLNSIKNGTVIDRTVPSLTIRMHL